VSAFEGAQYRPIRYPWACTVWKSKQARLLTSRTSRDTSLESNVSTSRWPGVDSIPSLLRISRWSLRFILAASEGAGHLIISCLFKHADPIEEQRRRPTCSIPGQTHLLSSTGAAIAVIGERLSMAPLAILNWPDLEPSDGLMDPHV
jgi:hypothetical protein